MRWLLPVAIATIAAICVAALGATITDLGPWYQSLQKPAWNPPDALFPIAWTLIFGLCVASGVTAWRAAPTRGASEVIVSLFALNAFLNITWSMLFFRLQRPDWAFIELMLLWLSVGALMIYTARYSKAAGLLLFPYLVWVTIAGALNWEVIALNGPFG